eukprot:6132958-Amphidinium_carterae.1
MPHLYLAPLQTEYFAHNPPWLTVKHTCVPSKWFQVNLICGGTTKGSCTQTPMAIDDIQPCFVAPSDVIKTSIS